MLLKFVYILYSAVAIVMVGLILMQRGSGAAAGSSFGAGGGASGSVFGAQGSANFLSKSTKWLAVVFFGLSLLVEWYISHNGANSAQNLGVMGLAPAAAHLTPASPTASIPPLQKAPQAKVSENIGSGDNKQNAPLPNTLNTDKSADMRSQQHENTNHSEN